MNRLLSRACLTLSLTLCGWGAWGAGGAAMGPPILCGPIDAGNVSGMPEDQHAKGQATKAITKACELLAGETSILAHMEAIRRSSVAMQGDTQAANAFLGVLACRALNEGASEDAKAGPLFDVAFYLACLNEMGEHKIGQEFAKAQGVRGYGLMQRAISLAEKNKDAEAAAMHFGAALMMHPAMRSGGSGRSEEYTRHLKAALQAAAPGSLLDKNISRHVANWGGSMADLRAK